MTQGIRENGNNGLRDKVQKHFTKLRVVGREPIWFIKNVGSAYQRPGIPDFIVCYCSEFGALELKVPGEQPTPKQQYELDGVSNAHGVAFTAHSMQEVEQFLDELRERSGWWPDGIDRSEAARRLRESARHAVTSRPVTEIVEEIMGSVKRAD
jgi:hypothetical protein